MKKPDIPLPMYRNIAPVLKDIFTISPEEFRKQIDLLKKEYYSIISLADLKEFLENGKGLSENSVVLGFDGNSRELIDIAVPILKENDFHAIFFINPDVIGKSESELNLEDIRYLLENNFEIGLNVSPEINLAQLLSAKKLLQEQKEKLESALNTRIYHVSYSADPITNELLNNIKESGFETAISSRNLLNNKYLTSFDLSRRQMTRKINLVRFMKLLKSPTLSMCVIAKNEEKFIGKCLESVKHIADDIVVDTGSSDKTKEIAASYGARIIDSAWEDDFSNARNIYVKNAAKDWIFTIDADEIIEPGEAIKIRQLLESEDFDAFSFIQRTYTNEENDVNFVRLDRNDIHGYPGYIAVQTIRLFRNNKGYYYSDAVHETIDSSLQKFKARIGLTDIPIHHYEILKGKEELKRKQLSYMEYSRKRLEANPRDVKAMCDIALGLYRYQNDPESAIPYLLKARETDPSYPRSYIILGEILIIGKKFEEAVPLYEKLLEVEPERRADNYYNLGQLHQILKQKKEAEQCFREALKLGSAKREDILRRLQQIS